MKLIILDRDGVINEDSDDYVKHPDEWHPIPGSLQAIAKLHQAGWRIAIATNQSGLTRHYFDGPTLNAMHLKMHKLVAGLGGAIDAIFVCPHGPDDGCDCRKPAPGLFKAIGERFDVSLAGVPAVGDSVRDLQAAAAVGCTPWLVQTGKGAKARGSPDLPPGTQHASDLADVVNHLLAQREAQ